jgi:cobalt/nickel transport system permease protein
MPSSYVDRYGRAPSICHRLPPRAKLLLTVTVVTLGVSIPVENWPLIGMLAVFVLVGHSLARIPVYYVARRLAIFLPMVLLMSISLPATQGFAAGWELMAAILLRSTLAFIAVLWLVNVLPFDQLLVTLRKLWVPEVLVALMAFMYRYSFVLWDEMDKMRAARRARNFGARKDRFSWKTLAQLIGTLLIRAMERAERVHGAMCARGWDGRIRSLNEPRS